jgi:dCTP deaminase
MILTGNEIRLQHEAGRILIAPYEPAQINPNSYDVRLGVGMRRVLDDGTSVESGALAGNFYLEPGHLYLGHTEEFIGSNHYVPLLNGKSSWARRGVSIHLTAGFGDLGFRGQWTLEMTTMRPITIPVGARIGQISFWQVQGEVLELYNGKYSGRNGLEEAK